MRFVIVGNGVAGTTASLHARKRDAEAAISIVCDERLPFYSRIRLIDYLAGTVGEEGLVIFKEPWYDGNRIDLLQGRRITSVKPSEKEVILDNGDVMQYDRLLLATGGRPAVPPIAGADKEGVFTLRAIEDARRILDYIDNKQDVVVLGGGVLGIEIGNALIARGKTVTVVEVAPRLLPRQTDNEASSLLRKILEAKGLSFRVGAKVREFAGHTRVEGVILDNGALLQGNAVIAATGIKPDTGLAVALGLDCSKGIPVNDRMETALPGIFAAGDAANHRGICYGTWQAAEKQGEIAGINMAGGDAVYQGTLPSHTLKVAGIHLLAAGDIDPANRLSAHVTGDPARGVYRKLVTDRGRLVGCILLGDLSGRKEILAAIDSRRPLDTLGDALIH